MVSLVTEWFWFLGWNSVIRHCAHFCSPKLFDILRHHFHRYEALSKPEDKVKWLSKSLIWMEEKPENFDLPIVDRLEFLGLMLAQIGGMIEYHSKLATHIETRMEAKNSHLNRFLLFLVFF